MRIRHLYLGLALLVGGCDLGDPGEHVPEPVVEAWLIAGQPLPPVRLTWTQDISQPYQIDATGIDSATVRIRIKAPNGASVGEVRYRQHFRDSDTYLADIPVGSELVLGNVVAGATYEIEVEVPDYPNLVTATTTVPGTFDLLGVLNETTVYQATDQVEIDVTRSFYPGRESVYVISIASLEPSIEGLTTFYRDIVFNRSSDEEFDPSTLDPTEIEDVIAQSSPPLNEANWEVLPGDNLRLTMPWFFVAFYGANHITVSAIDDNLWNLLRGINAQEGAGGLAPGEIPNIRAGVSGGQGVFGSMTRVATTVEILPEQD